jgi:3-deoxy-manno-octulosonate cytidylyltransferase (CMP-KDO synthetase)
LPGWKLPQERITTVPPVRVLAVIPARWGSTRFPGKPLALIDGRPMVELVYRQVERARRVDRILVATDDFRIRGSVEGFGGEAMLTSTAHASGSDRVAEVARQVDCEVVVNVQGDEPLVAPEEVDAAIQPLLDDPTLEVTTLAAPIASSEALQDPHVVKVVTDTIGNALYFSRAPIPYPLAGGETDTPALRHVGLYAYRRAFLLEFSTWQPTPLERRERLEQLRVLEHGRRIRVVFVASACPGVDTPEDLKRVESLLQRRSS